MLSLTDIVSPLLAFAAAAYAFLAVRIARAAPHKLYNPVCLLLFLMAGLLTGSAFSYGAADSVTYGIGRVFSFTSGAFAAVVFFMIYREYTVGRQSWPLVAMMAIVPAATMVLALTNPMHNMLWTAIETESGLRFSNVTDHYWYNRVYAPFTHGLIAYSTLGLAVRLPTIAPARRDSSYTPQPVSFALLPTCMRRMFLWKALTRHMVSSAANVSRM